MRHATTVTMDSAGRIVVPKSVREAMGLRSGSVLELALQAGMLTLAVPSVMQEQTDEQGRVFFSGPEGAPLLSDADVRSVIESVRP